MRILVFSWFFPPSTSSEGIVTYKLLRNSRHQYDVISSSSNQWGYNSRLETEDENIHVFPIDTDDLNEWRDEAIRLFPEMHEKYHYDAFMTRCMPNESLEVGLRVKEQYPDVKWICSLADPVANNPYWRHAIQGIAELSASAKDKILREMALPKESWSQNWLEHPSNSVRDQFYWKNIQDEAFKKADILITPSAEQRDFMDPDKMAVHKFLIVPHSYDLSLYDKETYDAEWESDKIHFTFAGYSDALRSLNPFIDAVKWIKEHYPEALRKIKIHFFGNYPREIVDRALAWQLDSVFDFSGNVSYWQTLAIMQKTDWLLHVDAFFPELSATGGSIFFAGKIADYIGAGKPILALTGDASPAGVITSQYGGEQCCPWETVRVAQIMMNIVYDKERKINEAFRQTYNAKNVAAAFDAYLENKLHRVAPSKEVAIIGEKHDTGKALTVCVPSYNAQSTLRRTLNTLLAVNPLSALEIIVVDDGSSDQTAEIGREYATKYPESVILVSKPNGGHGSGINQGMNLASGLYFRVVDSDDWVDSRGLSKELAYILKSSDRPDAIYNPYHIVDQGSGISTPFPLSDKIETDKLYDFSELVHKVGVENFYLTMAGTTFRTEVLRRAELQLKEKTFYTDSEFILKPIPLVKSVVFLPSPVYKYLRGQAEQSVAPLSFVRHYTDHEMIVRELIQFEQNSSMSDESRAYIVYILNQHLITNYRILLEFDTDFARGADRAKQFDQWLKDHAPGYYQWTEENIGFVRAGRKAQYSLSWIAEQHKRGNSANNAEKQTVRQLYEKALHSPVFMNRYTMSFIRKQKDNNGIIYKAYMHFKR